MVLISLEGLSPVWETFITTISNINIILTFDELLGKYIQKKARMISRGRISHHEEGEPTAFSAYDKGKKGNKKKYAFKSNKGILDVVAPRKSPCGLRRDQCRGHLNDNLQDLLKLFTYTQHLTHFKKHNWFRTSFKRANVIDSKENS